METLSIIAQNELLKIQNDSLKKEIEFINIPFTDYKLKNTAVFNIVRAKTLEGTDIWFNKIDPSTNEKFLRSLESNDYIEYLIENCNPKYER